ncbi:hypothetical protein HDV06_003839 [Boothiomyces sp. JEL0866]|nr:hypothetical protein HDV06_003839 [Boothiomyces sp. JEL0866]
MDNELIFTIASIALLVGYHIWFLWNLLYRPTNVIAGWTAKVRGAWVREILKKKGGDILAVQTLRNWILGATFLASVAVTISFGFLAFLAQLARVVDPTTNFLLTKMINDPNIGYKCLILLVCNFCSFFSFTQSIRYFNHVGYAINIPMVDLQNDEDTEEYFYESAQHVTSLLNLGARFYTLGLRCFYFSIPSIFWFFGALPLFMSVVVLLVLVHISDSAEGKLAMVSFKHKEIIKKQKTPPV